MPPTLPVRATFQPLERRILLSAGDIDTSFGDDGVASPALASEAAHGRFAHL